MVLQSEQKVAGSLAAMGLWQMGQSWPGMRLGLGVVVGLVDSISNSIGNFKFEISNQAPCRRSKTNTVRPMAIWSPCLSLERVAGRPLIRTGLGRCSFS